MQINIYEAKARLSALLDEAQRGEVVVIARAGKPIARLVALTPPVRRTRSGVRYGGLSRARLKLSPDFHHPGTDDELLAG